MTPDRFTLRVGIPANTTATVFIPTTSQPVLAESGLPIAEAAGVTLLTENADHTVVALASGSYEFTRSNQ